MNILNEDIQLQTTMNEGIGGAVNYRTSKSSPDKDYVYQITRNGEKLEDDKYQSLEDAKRVITNMKKGANPSSKETYKILKMKRPKLAGPTGKLPEAAPGVSEDGIVDEGAYEKSDPKHPKFKENHDKWKEKNPSGTLAQFIAHMNNAS